MLIPREALALPLNPVIYGIIYAVNADRMTGETDTSIASGKLQKLNLSVAMTSRQKEHKETEGSTRNNPTDIVKVQPTLSGSEPTHNPIWES